MARDFDGGNDSINFGSGATIDDLDPITVAIWLYPDDVNTGAWIQVVEKTNSSYSDGYAEYLSITGTGQLYCEVHRGTTVAQSISAVGSLSTGSWQHCCSRWTLDETPEVFIDGSEVSYASETAGSGTLSSNSGFNLILGDVGNGDDYEGRAAELALWDVQLTDAEISILSLGYSPLFVRPSSLVFYPPLIGRQSPEIDIVNGNNGTVTGAVNIAHPRMIYPAGPSIRVPAVAAPTGRIMSSLVGAGGLAGAGGIAGVGGGLAG